MIRPAHMALVAAALTSLTPQRAWGQDCSWPDGSTLSITSECWGEAATEGLRDMLSLRHPTLTLETVTAPAPAALQISSEPTGCSLWLENERVALASAEPSAEELRAIAVTVAWQIDAARVCDTGEVAGFVAAGPAAAAGDDPQREETQGESTTDAEDTTGDNAQDDNTDQDNTDQDNTDQDNTDQDNTDEQVTQAASSNTPVAPASIPTERRGPGFLVGFGLEGSQMNGRVGLLVPLRAGVTLSRTTRLVANGRVLLSTAASQRRFMSDDGSVDERPTLRYGDATAGVRVTSGGQAWQRFRLGGGLDAGFAVWSLRPESDAIAFARARRVVGVLRPTVTLDAELARDVWLSFDAGYRWVGVARSVIGPDGRAGSGPTLAAIIEVRL